MASFIVKNAKVKKEILKNPKNPLESRKRLKRLTAKPAWKEATELSKSSHRIASRMGIHLRKIFIHARKIPIVRMIIDSIKCHKIRSLYNPI